MHPYPHSTPTSSKAQPNYMSTINQPFHLCTINLVPKLVITHLKTDPFSVTAPPIASVAAECSPLADFGSRIYDRNQCHDGYRFIRETDSLCDIGFQC